jgi:MFS transporter, ACS family, glucarate transporter
MGFVFGAFGLSYALFELPAGLLGDRLGVRRVLSQIVLAGSIFTALTGAAWDITSLWVVRFLFGAGEAGCFPNLTRMLSVWLPARERVSAQSLMWACTRWGGAATPPLVLAGVALFGWRWTFVTLATLGIAWFAIFLLWFRDDPLQHPSVNVLERKMLAESRIFIRDDAGRSNWLSLLLTPEVFVLILQYFCFSFVWYFYITWCPRTCERLEPNRPRELPLSPRSLCFSVVLVPLLPDWWQPGFRAGSSRSSVSSDRRSCCSPSPASAPFCPPCCPWDSRVSAVT